MGIKRPDKPTPAPPPKHQNKKGPPSRIGKSNSEIKVIIETGAFLILCRRDDATLKVALVWDDQQALAAELMQAFNVPEDDFGPAPGAHGIGPMDVSITIKRPRMDRMGRPWH